MARPLRIEFDGALYHVISRGNERRRIVRDDADRDRRIDWLRRTVETYRWHLHAFVLMDNHDHLYVETPAGNLSVGMQHLKGGHTTGECCQDDSLDLIISLRLRGRPRKDAEDSS